MEWNWKMINKNNKNGMVDVTPFLLFESYGDSDDVITHVHHNHHEQEQEQEDMHDDAISCSSYDHASHVNVVKSHDDHTKLHHQGHHVYDEKHGHGHGHVHGYDHDDEDEDINDDDKNWGESKMIGQEKRCHEVFIDSSNLDDRQFWETCLGS